jgi:hypothetical protein
MSEMLQDDKPLVVGLGTSKLTVYVTATVGHVENEMIFRSSRIYPSTSNTISSKICIHEVYLPFLFGLAKARLQLSQR